MTNRVYLFWPRKLLPLVLTGAILVGCFVLYLREADQMAKNVTDREFQRTGIFARFVEQDLQAVIDDLKQLVDGDGLQDYLSSGKPSDLERARHRAWFYSRLRPEYDQVRFLDEKGMEVLRINANGNAVPPDKLQDKHDRSYFQKANELQSGQFYISAFDLNIENGVIEQPVQPMIRIATPVFDAQGQRRGIYIINYSGSHIVDFLEKFTPQFRQRLRILNSQGYWIHGASPEQEWGFMYPNRAGMTMARMDPTLWSRLANEPAGQVPHADGMFTWHRIVPSQINDARPGEIVAEDRFLVMGSEISPDEWRSYFVRLQQTFLIVAIVLLVLVAASFWFFRSRQAAQEELDRFFHLTRDMLCVAGFDGYFKRVNPAWQETLGYSANEMKSQPFLNFVHPEDREKTIRESVRLLKGGETVSFENRYKCKDGSYRWLSWSSRSLVGEKVIFASARDLTDRKRVEEEILRLNMAMKQRAAELEMANKELESFSYSVSHDLRAPLRHIHGFVELLQKSPAIESDESNSRYLKVIAKAARSMGELIDDLLAFSRTGRTEMHRVKVDMREIVDQIVRDSESDLKERKVVWTIKPMPAVWGDPALLRQVWINLISNALKYSRPRAETTIEIGHDEARTTGREAVFYIRDNGVGFDLQYATKLFGVFQRMHRAEDFEGTGIGLANVQRIIHRHGGHIWAESQVDSGATFYFSLPLVDNA